MIDQTHDPSLRSWVESANLPETDFPIQNLPFATCRYRSGRAGVGVAIGDQVLDAGRLFDIDSIEAMMAMPRDARVRLRRRISDFLATYTEGGETYLTPMAAVELLLPC